MKIIKKNRFPRIAEKSVFLKEKVNLFNLV